MHGISFRDAINHNKKCIIEFLANGPQFTRDICENYKGEKEMPCIRKALNELRKEGKITTDDHVHFWQGKKWELINDQSTGAQK